MTDAFGHLQMPHVSVLLNTCLSITLDGGIQHHGF